MPRRPCTGPGFDAGRRGSEGSAGPGASGLPSGVGCDGIAQALYGHATLPQSVLKPPAADGDDLPLSHYVKLFIEKELPKRRGKVQDGYIPLVISWPADLPEARPQRAYQGRLPGVQG
jgi:hypothetical protein